MALSLSILNGVVINLYLPAGTGLRGDGGVHVVGLCKGQDQPQGPLRHLKLVTDVLGEDLGPPQLKSPPFGGLFKLFACCYLYRSHGEFQLRKCERIQCLLKGPPKYYFLSEDGEFWCAVHY